MNRIHSVIGKRKPKNKPDEFIVGNNIGIDDASATPTNRGFHFSPKVFSAISVFVALFGVYTIFFSQAAPTTVANVWVAANGSDTGSNCNRFATPTANPDSSGASLCKSFSAALSAASTGDTIRVLSGTTYGSQSLTRTGLTRDSNFDNNIQFIADGGPGSVTLAGLSIGSSSANSYGAVNLDGFHVSGGPAIQETKDVRLSNFEANNQTYISNSQDIKLEKYTIQPSGFPSVTSAPFSNGWGIGIVQQGSGSVSAPSNITLDGINMHGVRATQAADHPDGVFMWRGGGVPTTAQWTGMKVRNSLFYNNECINWRYNDANPAQVEFENNFFDSSVNGISGCGYYSISVASATGIYRNNTIRGGIQVKEGDCPGTCGAKRTWTNNIILGGWSDQGCSNLSSDTWSKNILDVGKCGSNDITASESAIKFAGGSTYPDKLFLTSGSVVAIDKGDSSTGSYAATDYLGKIRPQGTAPDIGAYEFQAPAPSGPTANIWVDTNGGTCTRQATPSTYNDAAACSSLDLAYQNANPGELVLVMGGNYGDQVINDVPAKDGTAWNGTSGIKPTTIRSAPNEIVTANDLTTHASNLVLDGINTPISDASGVGEPTIIGPAHDVSMQNLKGRAFYITGPAYNVLIKNIEIGPRVAGSGSQIKTATNGGDDPDPAQQPHDITIDGLYMHDYTTDNPGTGHMDCLHVFYHYNLTVKNSKFIRCGLPNAGYGILLGSNGPGRVEHDVFENNVFDGAIAGFALRGGVGEDFNDVQVRYNSGGLITTQTTNTLTNVNWVANAATDIGPCRANSYSYNISISTACGSTDLKADPKFTSPSTGNYSLQALSQAIGRGSPAYFPQIDILGISRPQGATPDAGAYEYTSSSTGSSCSTKPGDTNNDSVVNITDIAEILKLYGQTNSTSCVDVNKDTVINISDIATVLQNYGK